MGILADFILNKIRGEKLLPIKSTLGHEDEFNREISFERKRDDLGRFDVIDLTSVKVAAGTELEMKDFREALRKPPLYDFIFRINDSKGDAVEFLIHCYGKHSKSVLAKDGRAYTPLLDISQLSPERKTVAIIQILTPKNRYLETVETRLAATDYCNDRAAYDARFNEMEVAAHYALWYYAYMATKFRNCPECFTQTGQGGQKIFTMGAEPVKPLRETKVERRVAAEEGEKKTEDKALEEAGDTHRTIACPYWTVRGHERHLKSGKVIWIEPYAKGKDRDNPERNVPKKYTI